MLLFPFSDGDLLGEYEFNPFVDEELDYDENMDEVVAEAPPEVAGADEGTTKEEDVADGEGGGTGLGGWRGGGGEGRW